MTPDRFINGEPARIILHGAEHVATFQRRPIDHIRIVSAPGTRIESRFMAARDVPAWLALQIQPKE
jgi:hypothetical protein